MIGNARRERRGLLADLSAELGEQPMKRLIAAMLVVAALAAATMADAAGRVALVIGNGAYEATPELANPVGDATAIAASLEALNFKVFLVTDADFAAANAAIGEFTSAISGAEIGLLFFAGHGIQIGGRNYLLPTDVKVDSEWALQTSTIDAQRLVNEMERRADVSIAILDACRDNPLVDVIARSVGGARSAQVERGLGPMQLSGRGAIIAFAAAAGDTASDGTGNHSPFTQALLEEIDEPNVEVGLMFRRVARRVRDETRGDQHPELLVRLVDEVYLNRTEGEAVVAATPEPAPVAAAEPAKAAPAGDGGQEIVVAANGRQVAAPGRVASPDKRFFGTRVIHTPSWVADAAVAKPSGWRSTAASAITEVDGNDSFATAQPLPLAAAVAARITPRGDNDWFRVEVPTRGELRVDVDPAPEDLDLNAQIVNADHQVIAGWQGAPGKGRALSARFPLPAPGQYWIQLVDGSNDAESSSLFTTNIDFVAADDPFEPNDSFGSASPLPTTAAFAPTIYPRGDNDWYKVWVAEPGLLQLTASNVPDALDVYMQVFDLNGAAVHGWVGPARKGGDTVLDAELPAPGTYLIQVQDGSNDAATVEPFTFNVDFLPVSDEDEPNNSFSEAVIVPPSGSRKIAIFPRGDQDWFAIDVDHPGELSLLATNSPENLDIYLRVLDADSNQVIGWTGPARKGGDVEAVADLAKPGRYFINVTDGSNDAANPQLFDLQLTYIAQPDQYEPNNGPGDAAPLTLGGQILFNILPRGDHDWFRIEVPTAGELALAVEEVAENLDIYYRVHDADRRQVVGWTGPPRKGGVTEGFADLPGPGTYYIELSDGSDDARSIEHATLSTTFTPIAESFEPNNSFSTAVPIKLGQPYRATILPRGDQDWYLMEAPRAGTFAVTVDEVADNLDIYVRLLDAEAKAGGWLGPPRKGGVTEAEIAVPAAGLYRLQVSDGSNDARSAKPYRIQVDFK